MSAWLCSWIASGRGHSFWIASRKRWMEPTPGLPPHEKTTPRAQPMPIIWAEMMSGDMRTSMRSRRPWRITSCPAANGMRCVKPSIARVWPSFTKRETASARGMIFALTRAVPPFAPSILDASMRIAIPASRSVSPKIVAGLIVLVFVVIAASAMLHTSTTFDEIVFFAVGARGFHTGDFSLVTDHPRLPQYLYGLPAFLSGIRYPSEAILHFDMMPRYMYARELLWSMGNPAEALMMKSRLVAIALGAGTVACTFAFARRHMGAAGALIAAVLVAFLPDMLAHSGIAYNDIALTFGYLLSVYAIDSAARKPTVPLAALAGLAIALTVCTKYSGVVLGPVAVVLVALEAIAGRWGDRAWRHRIALASLVTTVVVYLSIAIVYQGDWRLTQFAEGFVESLGGTLGRPAFLFGEQWNGGRSYFFPVLFFLKTPAALHVLMALAIVGA